MTSVQAREARGTTLTEKEERTMKDAVNRLLVMPALRVLAREDGQTLVEYSLILVIITIAAIAALTGIGGTIKGFFDNVAADFG
jgi:Flp pilus assembly pilin Flp